MSPMSRGLPRPALATRLSCCVLVAALLCPAVASAEEGDEDPVNPIIVTGEGLATPSSRPAYDLKIITRERLVGASSGRIEEVLAGVAGFQQFRRSDSRSSNPSAQGATLRALGGNATSRALVLLDGVPMADPFFGYIPFSALNPETLARVRVTRGGGSGAFGAGAVAGTIALRAKPAPRSPSGSARGSRSCRADGIAATDSRPRRAPSAVPRRFAQPTIAGRQACGWWRR